MASAMSDSEESAHSSDAELRLVLAGVKSLPTGDASGRSALVWGGGCAAGLHILIVLGLHVLM